MLQEYGTLKYEKISSLKHSITMIEKKECKGPTKKYWYKIRVVIRSLHISPVDMTRSIGEPGKSTEVD